MKQPAMNVLDLVRPDLRDFAGYRSARSDRLDGSVWLNANESPWANASDAGERLRRYPDPQPEALRVALAGLYGCRPDEVLAGRGSDEAIDLLVRGLCRPGGDAIVVTPPTFGMYAVSARLHGTRVIDVPLLATNEGYACDFSGIAEAVGSEPARVVFLCSPGNPAGNLLPLDAVAALAVRVAGQALVVVDEAYIEFARMPSAVGLLAAHPNVAVLRTLSKAHALAAARIGALVADASLIAVLQRLQAPYPLPHPCVEAAMAALGPGARALTEERIATTVVERERLATALAGLPGVRQVLPSAANFLLVRFDDAQGAFDALLSASIVVRDLRAAPGLTDALRITVGTREQNERVLDVLADAMREVAA